MKKTISAVALCLLLVSCKEKAAQAPASTDPTAAPAAVAAPASKADVSYAFGVALGQSLKATGVEFDLKQIAAGIKDVVVSDKPKITTEEAQMRIQTAIMGALQKVAEENLVKEKAFFAENGKKPGVVTTASGLQYEVIKEGTGPRPVETDTVKVDYVGTLIDGTMFDSSIEAGEPAVFPVGMVIPGWIEALQLMNVGSKYKVYIPSMLAYGEQGSQGGIDPNTPLIFEIDLLSIEPPTAP